MDQTDEWEFFALADYIVGMEIELEHFTPKTVEPIKDMFVEEHSSFHKWLSDPEDLCSPDFMVVARDKDKILGWAAIGLTRGREHHPLIGVFVNPEDRKKGVAKALVSALLKEYPKFYGEDDDYHNLGYILCSNDFPFRSLIENAGY